MTATKNIFMQLPKKHFIQWNSSMWCCEARCQGLHYWGIQAWPDRCMHTVTT